jgi:putative acetyltransferase
LAGDHAEIKSMRTEPAFRGRGLAQALLHHVLTQASAQGFGRVSLETGADESYAAARALYAKAGFLPCEAFPPYTHHPTSAYMSLALTTQG